MRARKGQRYYYFATFLVRPELWREIQLESAHALAGLDTFFWSGISDATELVAAGTQGSAVGVGVTALSGKRATPLGPTLLKAVEKLPASTPIFVDSGAYGAERAGLNLDRLKVKGRPAWDWVFSVYERLAQSRSPENVFVVAPDKKGSQSETLRRLRAHSSRTRKLFPKATVLVALQPGALSIWAMAEEVDKILGPGWVPALPLAAPGALRYFTPQALGEFVRRRRPSLVHLLGAGPATRGSRADQVVPHLRQVAQRERIPLQVQSDSALSRAITRATTAYREGIKKEFPIDQLGPFEAGSGVWILPDGSTYDVTEDWALGFDGLPPKWLKGISREIAVDPSEPGPSSLTPQERRAFQGDPVSFLEYPPRPILWDHQMEWLAHELLERFVYDRFIDQIGATRLRALPRRSAGLDRIQAAPLAPRATIGLVGCGKAKDAPGRTKSWRGPARELYTGSVFRSRRDYFEDSDTPYFIVSAKHGLVDPSQPLGKYCEPMPSSLSIRTAKAQGVVEQLQRRLGTLRGKSFEFHAGRDYLDPLAEQLRRQGATVETPTRGMDIFELQRFYKKYRDQR